MGLLFTTYITAKGRLYKPCRRIREWDKKGHGGDRKGLGREVKVILLTTTFQKDCSVIAPLETKNLQLLGYPKHDLQ